MPDAGSRAAVALRIGSNLDRAPTVISKIQIDPTVMLPDAEVNGQSGGVKLSPAGRLRRAQTPLRALGIEISFGREGRAGTRIIRLRTSRAKPTRAIVSTVGTVGKGID